MPHSATIIITTKNRREELGTALRSALAQTVFAEILVIDDGSTDGTPEMVHSMFPSVHLERSETSLGYIVQRNRAARIASGDILFSIDDDAVFVSPHTVEQTLREFDRPCVGAVAIPYLEPHKSPVVRQQAPLGDVMFVTDDFIGTAHAVRKDVFLQLGGYREFLVHQGEEMDFCIRMLATGYVVRVGRADIIHHLESPRRDFRRMDFYGRRNDILFVWHNVPWPYFPFHLMGTTLNGFIAVWRTGRPAKMLRGMASGYVDCFRCWNDRLPVPSAAYRLNRLLKKRELLPLEEVESHLIGWAKKSLSDSLNTSR